MSDDTLGGRITCQGVQWRWVRGEAHACWVLCCESLLFCSLSFVLELPQVSLMMLHLPAEFYAVSPYFSLCFSLFVCLVLCLICPEFHWLMLLSSMPQVTPLELHLSLFGWQWFKSKFNFLFLFKLFADADRRSEPAERDQGLPGPHWVWTRIHWTLDKGGLLWIWNNEGPFQQTHLSQKSEHEGNCFSILIQQGAFYASFCPDNSPCGSTACVDIYTAGPDNVWPSGLAHDDAYIVDSDNRLCWPSELRFEEACQSISSQSVSNFDVPHALGPHVHLGQVAQRAANSLVALVVAINDDIYTECWSVLQMILTSWLCGREPSLRWYSLFIEIGNDWYW